MRLARKTPGIHPGTAINGDARPDPMEAAPGLAQLFHDFFERMSGPARDFAERFVNPDEAEDAVQEAMADTWIRWLHKGPDATPDRFFLAIVRHKAIDQRRANRRVVSLEDAEGELDWQVFRASQTSLRGDTPGDVLDLALAALPPKRREAFLLVHEHEFTYKEVGTLMRVSEGTMNTHMRLAKQQIHQAFAKKDILYAAARQARLPAPAVSDAPSAPAEPTHE